MPNNLRLTERTKTRLAAAAITAVAAYVWIAHPKVMAGVLLAVLVFAMLLLAVAAMRRGAQRKRRETLGARALRLVNEYEPQTHWWA
jgi:hypothetical protein